MKLYKQRGKVLLGLEIHTCVNGALTRKFRDVFLHIYPLTLLLSSSFQLCELERKALEHRMATRLRTGEILGIRDPRSVRNRPWCFSNISFLNAKLTPKGVTMEKGGVR